MSNIPGIWIRALQERQTAAAHAQAFLKKGLTSFSSTLKSKLFHSVPRAASPNLILCNFSGTSQSAGSVELTLHYELKRNNFIVTQTIFCDFFVIVIFVVARSHQCYPGGAVTPLQNVVSSSSSCLALAHFLFQTGSQKYACRWFSSVSKV